MSEDVTSRKRVADLLIRHLGIAPLQPFYQGLLRLALLGMNVGGGTQKLQWSGEIRVMRYLKRVLASDGQDVVVFDVGAHSGKYAATVLSIFGATTRIHCFEPAHATCETLHQRFRDEPRVRIHELALGRQAGRQALYTNPDRSGLASFFDGRFQLSGVEATATEEVDVVRLDALCAEAGIERIHFLKIDVEGADFDVLQGAGRMLAEGRIDAIQFEFGECHLVSRTFFYDFFTLLNPEYQLYRVLPRGLAPLPTYRTTYDIFVSGTNYLAISRRLGAGP